MEVHIPAVQESPVEASGMPAAAAAPRAMTAVISGMETTVAAGPSHDTPPYMEFTRGARAIVTVTPAQSGVRMKPPGPRKLFPSSISERTAP